MKVAVVDLGTNTFNLLIAELSEGQFHEVLKEKQAVKLGKSGINSGIIAPDAFQRGLTAMKHYEQIIKAHGADLTVATATSAMRDAANSDDFITRVKEETGISIEVISGLKEAELIQKGVALTLPSHLKDYVIMDLGGGSTEFIVVVNSQVVWSKSYNLGVSRLLDWLKPSDPILPHEISKLKERINHELADLYDQVRNHDLKIIIGSSGSFDSFHDMISVSRDVNHPSSEIDFSSLQLNEVNEVHEKLLRTTTKERLEFPGLIEMRADMIVISSIEINTVLTELKTTHLYRSGYALKEGLLSTILADEVWNKN